MPLRPFGPSRIPTSAVMLTVSGLAVVGMALASPDALLERELEQALNAGAPPATMAQRTASKAKPAVQLSGSEEFWLKNSATDHGRNIVPAVTVGDSITVNTGGQQRTLHVTGVKEIPGGEVTRIDTSGRTQRMFIVTCEEAGQPDGASVKFLMEMDGAAAGVAAKPNRTL